MCRIPSDGKHWRKTLNLPSNSLRPIKEIWLMMNVNTSRRRLHSSNVWGFIHCCWTASMEQPTSPSIWFWTYSARIPFGHSREDWLPSINLLSRILTQWNTSFHLLYPSPDFISFGVIPAVFSSPAIPSICKILKLCPFGILSIYTRWFIITGPHRVQRIT